MVIYDPDVSRKNIILTLWFIAPLATFAGLYVLIFVTLDNDRPMRDAAPIGAGAGDTGNANALGQWLAGRDPDAVSLANKAKRERLMISPRDWPGGIELRVPAEAVQALDGAPLLTQIYNERGRYSTTTMQLNSGLGMYVSTIDAEQLAFGDRFVLATSLPIFDGQSTLTDERGNALRILTLSTVIPPSRLGVNDPLPVLVPIDSIYVEQSP
jgi:hypothetical protein